ncbi:hypothetical protein [Symmachiella macrocystis]|uniref:hypothetical protein n=1 Tax=Symmachiella macrocystis TaxID=2527985 RepID=UPI0011B6C2A6|nr:hypothetical protein [Symmachiella macrocystis]
MIVIDVPTEAGQAAASMAPNSHAGTRFRPDILLYNHQHRCAGMQAIAGEVLVGFSRHSTSSPIMDIFAVVSMD